jgi:hypothetical protein
VKEETVMIRLIDPRGELAHAGSELAPRPQVSSVRRIGFLSNEEEFMQAPLHFPRYTRILQRVLPQRISTALEFHSEVKPVLSRPAGTDQLEALARCHGVINGLAK